MNRADIVIGLGFGDEGKGSWVDHLVRKHRARTVVRFNGGAQAGHQVVTTDGREHIFAQFGSGMFVPGTETLLSRFMLVEPEALLHEASVLEKKGVPDPLTRMIISEDAPVVGPFNRLLNRVLEVFRQGERHGSCGFGIGMTQADVENLGERALFMRDLKADGGLAKMRDLLELKVQHAQSYHNEHTARLIETLKEIDLAYYADLFLTMYHQVQVLSDEECLSIIRSGGVVFEGAQGVLLDQCYGFFPYCTRSNCTFKNALQLLSEAGFEGETVKTGLLRAYGTRHGAGPFPTEDPSLEVAPCHNHFNEWQGNFRTGWFDAVLARFALDVVGDLDVLAITNVDRLFQKGELKIATRYEGSQAISSDGERLEVINGELHKLEERTRQIAMVVPQYQTVSGINDNENELQHYLDSLSQAIRRNVDAFSASPHQKLYRTLL